MLPKINLFYEWHQLGFPSEAWAFESWGQNKEDLNFRPPGPELDSAVIHIEFIIKVSQDFKTGGVLLEPMTVTVIGQGAESWVFSYLKSGAHGT